MKLIGLLGGVASGKSTVADLFQQCGAAVLDADAAGHEVLKLPAVRAAIGGAGVRRSSGPTAKSTAIR